MYHIKEISDLTGVSIRMLRHYDKIGLLKPAKIEMNGYRLYDNDNLKTLQEIMFLKELDFTLEEINQLLQTSSFHQTERLKNHRELLIERKIRLEKIIRTIDKMILEEKGELTMTKEDMFESFDMKEIEAHKKKYEKETKEKYGNTDAYKESQQKTSNYNKNDWARIKGEFDTLLKRLAALMETDYKSAEVQKEIDAYRNHITTNYYNCTIEIFRGLGQMYIADGRFTKNIDANGEGLSKFLEKAITYYCDTNQN